MGMEGVPEFMGYDRAIVTFSPDGRLFQVEYAREAVKRGTTSLGLVFENGVVLAAVRPLPPLAVPNSGSDKINQIDDHIGAALSGFIADGRVLIETARVYAQIYRMTYEEPIDVMGIVKDLSDRMQVFTQYGGVRPFGVALLIGGIDEKGPHLFELDPSSAFYSWKAQAIGRGAEEALKLLRKKWKDGMSEDEAVKLALKALKSGEKDANVEEIELAVITDKKGYVKYSGYNDPKFFKKLW